MLHFLRPFPDIPSRFLKPFADVVNDQLLSSSCFYQHWYASEGREIKKISAEGNKSP
jgi:hypothetical protein